jgi:hypothetical protein
MAYMHYSGALQKPGFSQTLHGAAYRLLLNVACPYMTCLSNEVGKQEGVLAVATGGVQNMRPLLKVLLQDGMYQWYRASQIVTVDGHGKRA